MLPPEEWVSLCSAPFIRKVGREASGASWLVGGVVASQFYTAAAPNSAIPDCGYRLDVGVFTSRSLHPNGVNAVMFDGSVHFIRDAISLPIWQAMSTRARGELIPSEW